MPWPTPRWCLYDIPNEHVVYCKDGHIPTIEELKNNVIKMPTVQAKMIRSAKNLPMPSPPVKVKVSEDLKS